MVKKAAVPLLYAANGVPRFDATFARFTAATARRNWRRSLISDV
jgi:hypothetical protein